MSRGSGRELARLMQDARAGQARKVFDEMDLRMRMACLARNLRDAAGCALAAAFQRYVNTGLGRPAGEQEWEPNLDGLAAPGWER